MAGKFEYKKVCKFCGNTFTAQKSTTKYCSETCAGRANKAEKRQERLQAESEFIQEHNRQNLLSQENLSLTDAAVLLGISRPTLYKLLNDRNIKLLRISKRTIRVKKSDLMDLYQNQSEKPAPINTPIAEINKKQEEHITVAEALQLFKISNTYLYNKIRAEQIQSVIIKGKAHYPKNVLKRLFAKNQYANISEWYTVAEIIEKFGVSQQYVYEYTSDHKMPKKREGKTVLISKYHWDKSRGLDQTESENYYTVSQATEKFAIGRSHLYDLIRAHKLPKVKRGQSILIHCQELDNIMNNRKR
ncbi:helix-turn-helix domain-containing protein [Porphyromonadaceae sp. NP-X]|jgi:excisionase family DNA binding protein|nr:helix-turn-helix domain-containing protein [Porphyromonadaceae sp. NP-X]